MNEYIVLFVLFSLLGWIWESIFCTIKNKRWENRGFLFSPICPIYGFAGIIGVGLYEAMENGLISNLSFLVSFIVFFVVSLILEFFISWILEVLFKARWWDYSKIPLNINGRTSVPSSLGFGAAGAFAVRYLIPVLVQLVNKCPSVLINLIALIDVAIISVDATLTVSALTDFQKKIAIIDSSFQDKMSGYVNSIMDTASLVQKKVIKRIAIIKLSGKDFVLQRKSQD